MKAGRCKTKALVGGVATTLYGVSGNSDIVFVVPDERIVQTKLDFTGPAPGPSTMRQFRLVLKEEE